MANAPVHNPVAQVAPHALLRVDRDWICPGDLIRHEEGDKTRLPVIAYPDECWYCGLCESICPVHAITIVFPEQMVHNRSDVVTLLGKVVE